MSKPESHLSTAEERAKHLAQANANQAIEGIEPSAEDKAIQEKYVEGTASVEDLLQHAKDFVKKVQGK